MTLLQAYLQSPKARRTLSKRPGDKGFSLIELVVVVAILAILAAVALPNFLGVSKDGQIAAAKNTLATIAKECAVKETRTNSGTIGTTKAGENTGSGAPIQAMSGNLNGYIITTDTDPASTSKNNQIILGTTAKTTSCYTATAKSDNGSLPNFTVSFNPQTGVTTKACHGEKTATYLEGCLNSNGNGDVVKDNATPGIW